jgi:chemotaxis response regulator CheB
LNAPRRNLFGQWPSLANRDIVAIGTFTGGFEALRFLAKGFKNDFSSFDPSNYSSAA